MSSKPKYWLIQMPTTASSTVDNRPQVIFKSNSSVDLSRLNVVVDGLDNGSAAHFSNKALRLLLYSYC